MKYYENNSRFWILLLFFALYLLTTISTQSDIYHESSKGKRSKMKHRIPNTKLEVEKPNLSLKIEVNQTNTTDSYIDNNVSNSTIVNETEQCTLINNKKPPNKLVRKSEPPHPVSTELIDFSLDINGNKTFASNNQSKQFQISMTNFGSNEQKTYYEVLGYVGSWRTHQQIVTIPVNKLDILIYSSFDANPQTGKCVLSKDEENKIDKKSQTTFMSIKELKLVNPNMKVLASLGGWQYSPNFYKLIFLNDDKARETLVESCILLMFEKQIFDGVDLNIQFPCPPGYPCRDSITNTSANDKDKFTSFINLFREKLGSTYIISVTGSASKLLASQIDFSKISKSINFVNILTFDFRSRKSGFTGHITNPNTSDNNPYSVQSVVQFYVETLKLSPSKINIGVAFFARGYKLRGECDFLLTTFCSIDPKQEADIPDSELSYRAIYNKYIYYNSNIFSDDNAKAIFVADGTNFYSFDDPLSVRQKLQIMKDKGLNGIFGWELLQDNDSFDLLEAMSSQKVQFNN